MKQSCKKILEETAFVIQQLDLNEFVQELNFLHGNSIGKHIRHTLEMFESVVEANESKALNYDLRKRNIQIENSISISIEKINALNLQIENLKLNRNIQLFQQLNTSCIELKSQIQRELLHCLEHSIHHLMIVRLAIEHNFPHVIIPQNFGMAHSTLQYKQSCEA